MKKNLLIPFIIGNLLLIATLHGFSQTGINTDGTPPDPSAGLDVKFPNKGLLPPRMTNEQMNAIPNPVSGLCVFFSDCGPSGTGALAMFMNGGWYAISMSCAVPASPAAAANTPDLTQITWNWNTVAGAAGYKWNTTNSYATATDMGTLTSKTETGLTCSTAYTRYAWAYNTCGNSQPVTLNQATSSCQFACGSPITISHVAGAVAPVSKTVTYGTINNIPVKLPNAGLPATLAPTTRQPMRVMLPNHPQAGTGSLTENRGISMTEQHEPPAQPGSRQQMKPSAGRPPTTRAVLSWAAAGGYRPQQNGPM